MSVTGMMSISMLMAMSETACPAYAVGGVPIAGSPDVLAHSDGDVLLHALMDALLGCIGAGDIGTFFPDSDPAFDNVNSAVLLDTVLEHVQKAMCTLPMSI